MKSLWRIIGVIFTLHLATACLQQDRPASDIKISDIPQTPVKDQSIGNCWAYAVTSWIESMHLMETGNKIDLSETYISYWASYINLLQDTEAETLQTGGGWELARRIILEYGWMLEKDFNPADDIQQNAEKYINKQLKSGGHLYGKASRTPDNIIKELDAAFQVDGLAAKKKAAEAKDLVIGKRGTFKLTLKRALQTVFFKWSSVSFPQEKGAQTVSNQTIQRRAEMIKRIQKAINDHMPIVISFEVAFGLKGDDNHFTMKNYKDNDPKSLGSTGRHMAVITDYVVDDVPGVGTIGEGEVANDLKVKALDGKVRYFKIKNSWGDEGPSKGFYYLHLDYLSTNVPWPHANNQKYSALRDIILPPGY